MPTPSSRSCSQFPSSQTTIQLQQPSAYSDTATTSGPFHASRRLPIDRPSRQVQLTKNLQESRIPPHAGMGKSPILSLRLSISQLLGGRPSDSNIGMWIQYPDHSVKTGHPKTCLFCRRSAILAWIPRHVKMGWKGVPKRRH